MNCVHRNVAPQLRPQTLVAFGAEEVAEALRDYALRMGQQMPTGKMHVWRIDRNQVSALSEVELVIERDEGQEVWPPKDVGDG